jgi:hypothetical protein
MEMQDTSFQCLNQEIPQSKSEMVLCVLYGEMNDKEMKQRFLSQHWVLPCRRIDSCRIGFAGEPGT